MSYHLNYPQYPSYVDPNIYPYHHQPLFYPSPYIYQHQIDPNVNPYHPLPQEFSPQNDWNDVSKSEDFVSLRRWKLVPKYPTPTSINNQEKIINQNSISNQYLNPTTPNKKPKKKREKTTNSTENSTK